MINITFTFYTYRVTFDIFSYVSVLQIHHFHVLECADKCSLRMKTLSVCFVWLLTNPTN